MEYIHQTDCKEWQFTGLPAFDGGTLHPLFADCGDGLVPGADAHSFMHIFTDTQEEKLRGYAEKLAAEGFGKLYERETPDGLFYQFRVPDGLLWISFFKKTGTARFILDRCRQSDAASFGGETTEAVRDDTVLAQYSLYYDKMIRGTSCDCGMNYVFRLRDGRLIIIDGGEFEQSTDEAVSDYLEFLHELTGTGSGEKLRVALWLCTHAHNDHCDFFSKLLRFHADEFILERTAFDFPEPGTVRHSPSVDTVRQRIAEAFPDALYMKLHAGNRFSFAGAEIDILLSAEDTVGLSPDRPFCGTNDTSVIFTVTADGIRTLFLADCGDENGGVLISSYAEDALSCELLQAAHHGINEIFPVYDRIDARVVLLPQCRMNMDTRFSPVYGFLGSRYGEDNILFAADKTDIFAFSGGNCVHTVRTHKGGAYDGSEW